MTARHFGLSARGAYTSPVQPLAPAQSPGNDCNLNSISSAVQLPPARSDLAPPDDWRSFIPLPSGSILECGDVAQSAFDVFAALFLSFFASLLGIAVGLVGFVAYLLLAGV